MISWNMCSNLCYYQEGIESEPFKLDSQIMSESCNGSLEMADSVTTLAVPCKVLQLIQNPLSHELRWRSEKRPKVEGKKKGKYSSSTMLIS